jgi:hypothetical protein
MTGYILLLSGSFIIIGWGIFHIVPTKRLVKFFGSISEEKKCIIIMEWVVEGFTLGFIGILVLLVTLLKDASSTPVSTVVYRASALMLVVMAAWTGVTGARTSIVPIKLCPVVKTLIAILFFLGSVL